MPGLNSTRAEAAERAAHLHVESYELTLDLTAGDEIFLSKTIIKFTCNRDGYDSFIDAVGKSVISATLNGLPVDTTNYDGETIYLKNLAPSNEEIKAYLTSHTLVSSSFFETLKLKLGRAAAATVASAGENLRYFSTS
jgi:hypothetical protein